jgi:hypothetical protein
VRQVIAREIFMRFRSSSDLLPDSLTNSLSILVFILYAFIILPSERGRIPVVRIASRNCSIEWRIGANESRMQTSRKLRLCCQDITSQYCNLVAHFLKIRGFVWSGYVNPVHSSLNPLSYCTSISEMKMENKTGCVYFFLRGRK